jgi:hypothetical protein
MFSLRYELNLHILFRWITCFSERKDLHYARKWIDYKMKNYCSQNTSISEPTQLHYQRLRAQDISGKESKTD